MNNVNQFVGTMETSNPVTVANLCREILRGGRSQDEFYKLAETILDSMSQPHVIENETRPDIFDKSLVRKKQ